jgi:hypothetical protein
MPYGIEVLATFRGWLPSQDDLPSHRNAIGNLYMFGTNAVDLDLGARRGQSRLDRSVRLGPMQNQPRRLFGGRLKFRFWYAAGHDQNNFCIQSAAGDPG